MTAMARPALLYFLLWLGVTLSTAMDLEKRIIGGETCGNDEGLYHVDLSPKNWKGKEYISHCGGSLIRDQWVLTAAHCWKTLGSMKAVVNIHPGGEKEEIDIIKHIIYTKTLKKHNIMLLKLSKKPQKVHTVDLPTAAECKTDVKVGDMLQVAGLGINAVDAKNEFEEQYPAELQCLSDVPVVQCNKAAEESIKKTKFPNPVLPVENAFCAQDPAKYTATGDSGGGAVIKGKIFGIAIGGNPLHVFVEPFYFLRVCKYLSWIESTTAKN